MSRSKKSETPMVSGAFDTIGLFEAEDRTIKLDAIGRVTVVRRGKPPIHVYVDMEGRLIVSGDDAITIVPGASNMIRIL